MIVTADTNQKGQQCGVFNAAIANHTQIQTQESLRYLREVILQTRDMAAAFRSQQQKLLPEIISNWLDIKTEQKEKNRLNGHLFNPLAFLPIAEPTHSCLIGDLLNPRGSHGQGRLLLEVFLRHLGVPRPEEGVWTVTMEEGRVDVLLYRITPASVIIIENKSNGAQDQPNQLYRYWHENIQKPYPNLNYSADLTKRSFQLIYLPATVGKEPAPHSLGRPPYLDKSGLPATLHEAGVTLKILTFRENISLWLENCEELIPQSNTRLKTHLEFYKELWR